MIIAKIVANVGTIAVSTVGGVIAADGAASELPSWLQYGVLGLVIVGLVITKQLVPGWIHSSIVNEYKEEIKELKGDLKEFKTENRLLTEKLFDSQKAAIPALGDASKAIDEALAFVRSRGK